MKVLLNIAMILGFAAACAGGPGGGVTAPRMPEGKAQQMPDEQLNPRTESDDASGITGSGSNTSTGSTNTGSSTTPTTNTGSSTDTTTGNSGTSTTPSGSGSTGNANTPDLGGLSGIPCAFGQACESKAELIKHCVQKVIIPGC